MKAVNFFLEENKGIGLRMRMLSNAIKRYLDGNSSAMRELDNITCSNKWIIGYLFNAEEEGREVFQRDFESNFGITRSTVSKMFSLLEKKNFIRREGVSHDARLKKITLTDKSREIAKTMRAEVEDIEEKLIAGFSQNELDQLTGYFERLQINLDSAKRERECAGKRGDNL